MFEGNSRELISSINFVTFFCTTYNYLKLNISTSVRIVEVHTNTLILNYACKNVLTSDENEGAATGAGSDFEFQRDGVNEPHLLTRPQYPYI